MCWSRRLRWPVWCCWDRGRRWQPSQPGTSITAGLNQECALEAGQAFCWGTGALGNGSASSGIPAPVDTGGYLAGRTLAQFSAGDGFACALDTSGVPYCWGDNTYGELGDGIVPGSDLPVPVDASGVLAGKAITQISVSADDACAVDSADAAYCWGDPLTAEILPGTCVRDGRGCRGCPSR